jgi:hypothetical protein
MRTPKIFPKILLLGVSMLSLIALCPAMNNYMYIKLFGNPKKPII